MSDERAFEKEDECEDSIKSSTNSNRPHQYMEIGRNDRSWLSYPLAVSTTSKEQNMKRESKNEWFSLGVVGPYYLYAPPN